MLTWPPSVEDVKADLAIADDVDDDVLQNQLDAAISFVERVRSGCADFDALALGTVRLAGRWYTRRRSPDGLVAMGELGASRIPAFDADIERLLGIGRYARAVIA